MLGIIQALSFKGWRVFRMPPSIYSNKGIPDLCACKWGVTVWIEVKRNDGKLSPQQQRFGQMISDAGGLYIVARSVEYVVNCCERIVISNGGSAIVPGKGMRLVVE
jgi:hypothetical protein